MRARNDMNSRVSATLDMDYNDLRGNYEGNYDGNYWNRRKSKGNYNYNYRGHDSAEILKVSTHSRPSAVAGAIAGVIRSQGHADVQAVGAGATNQAIKSIAIAREYLRPNGLDLAVVPAFVDIEIDNEERTAIRLEIEARPI
jgi:stage V sporulation protein S